MVARVQNAGRVLNYPLLAYLRAAPVMSTHNDEASERYIAYPEIVIGYHTDAAG